MIEFYSGVGLWAALAEDLPIGTKREAAIAYIGAGASRYLSMAGDVDLLVFDGCDENVAAGLVDLDEIATLMDNDVSLFSREGLHSKMMYVEDEDRALAVVGSANISRNSVQRLFESAVVFDDETEVERVRLAIDATHAGLSPIGLDWLEHARTIPKRRRGTGPKWKPVTRPLADRHRPLWLFDWQWNGPTAPSQVELARREVATDSGVHVDVFPIVRIDYERLAEGDSVLMVGWPQKFSQPRANAPIDEPGLVRRLIDTGRRQHRYWMVYATRSDAKRYRWDEVRDALYSAGWDNDWRGNMTGAQRDRVFDLFRGETI